MMTRLTSDCGYHFYFYFVLLDLVFLLLYFGMFPVKGDFFISPNRQDSHSSSDLKLKDSNAPSFCS